MLQKIYDDCKNRMDKSLSVFKKDLLQLRTGRASATILEPIKVDYYGTPTPLSQVANVSIPEPRTINIKPWDVNMIDAICKSILASDIGITPQPDKNIIRLVIPQLTEETRKKIVKTAKNKCEDCKISIRNIRRDVNTNLQTLEKKSEISEDDLRKALKIVQDITDEKIKVTDEVFVKKEKEILEV